MEHRFAQDEKDAFLALLRAGKEPPEAAQMIRDDYTASMFRRITNEGNKQYDPRFAADYFRARAEGRAKRDPARPAASAPRTTTLSGHLKAAYITEDMLDQFLELIENGVPMKQAAEILEPKTSLSQIHKRALRDQAFADRYASAKEAGYPIYKENLKAEWYRQAMAGNYAALKDQLLFHDPEVREALGTHKHEITGAPAEMLRQLVETALPGLPDEIVERFIKELEQRQIEPPDVIEGDAEEAA